MKYICEHCKQEFTIKEKDTFIYNTIKYCMCPKCTIMTKLIEKKDND
jgi:hypothetical protein